MSQNCAPLHNSAKKHLTTIFDHIIARITFSLSLSLSDSLILRKMDLPRPEISHKSKRKRKRHNKFKGGQEQQQDPGGINHSDSDGDAGPQVSASEAHNAAKYPRHGKAVAHQVCCALGIHGGRNSFKLTSLTSLARL